MPILPTRNRYRWISWIIFCAFLAGCSAGHSLLRGQSPSKATSVPTITDTPIPAVTPRAPTFTETPHACSETSGKILEESYGLPDGDSKAAVKIYLPPCYDKIRRELPIAYFLHGYPQDENHWIELGVVETYENLLALELVDPVVLIFPAQPEPYFTETDGGPGSFEEVFLEHLIQAAESNLRVSDHPSQRAILGVSRGAVWALEIGLRHPEQFNTVGALSPALAYNHPRRVYDPFFIALSTEVLPTNLLVSVGDREPQFSDEIERFVQALESANIELEYLQHAGRHEDAAWQAILDQVLIFVADAVR